MLQCTSDTADNNYSKVTAMYADNNTNHHENSVCGFIRQDDLIRKRCEDTRSMFRILTVQVNSMTAGKQKEG